MERGERGERGHGARASRPQLCAGETCSLKYGDGRRGGARPSRSQLSAVPIQSNQVHNARRAVACIHIFLSRAIAGKMPALLLVATDQLCKQLRAGRPRFSRSTSTCDGCSRLPLYSGSAMPISTNGRYSGACCRKTSQALARCSAYLKCAPIPVRSSTS